MPMAGLQVKTYAVNNSSGHTFYVMAADGSAPDREKVNKACLEIGGKLVHPGAGLRAQAWHVHMRPHAADPDQRRPPPDTVHSFQQSADDGRRSRSRV